MAKQFVSIEEMITIVGEFGLFQLILDGVFSLATFPQTFPILIMYFAALSPDWKCVSNSTVCTSTGTFPKSDDTRCSMNRSDWEFTEPKTYSITTQFDLVCDDKWLADMTTSIMFIGWITGAIVLGWIADNYGRKTVFFPALGVCISLGFATSFSPNIALILALRFFVGFCIPGITSNSFVMISEVVGGKYRPFAGIILFFFFTIALCLQALKAYFIREWKMLYIVCTIPYIFVLFFYPVVPESVRWLQIHGKTEKLNKIFQKIAKWNKRSIPEDTVVEEKSLNSSKKASPIDLFRGKKNAISTLVQGYAWLVNGMVYYGISLAADDLGGSLYVNYVLVSIAELPAVLCAIYFCERFGRKITIVSTLGLGSVACIIVAFIPRTGGIKILRLIFGILGKFFISIDFNGLYTWSVEIYPTNLRSQGMGFLQVTSRIGAATAPFVANSLIVVHKSLPFIVMGVAALIGFALLFILPETKGKHLTAIGNEASVDGGIEMESIKQNQVAPN